MSAVLLNRPSRFSSRPSAASAFINRSVARGCVPSAPATSSDVRASALSVVKSPSSKAVSSGRLRWNAVASSMIGFGVSGPVRASSMRLPSRPS